MNKLLSYSDSELGRILLASADLEIESYRFSESVAEVGRLLDDHRQLQMTDYRQVGSIAHNVFVTYPDKKSIDEFGLPLPSDSQTSEDQK